MSLSLCSLAVPESLQDGAGSKAAALIAAKWCRALDHQVMNKMGYKHLLYLQPGRW